MKSRWKILSLGIFLLISIASGWTLYYAKYPYGRTHRCSKMLALLIIDYAKENGGIFPVSNQPGAMGLAPFLKQYPEAFELIVGKAGDLSQAKQFYLKHGYLKPEHSSWHYTPGLTIADSKRAILWDRIPLGHNGERTESKSREVIMMDGSVKTIPATEWQEFLQKQNLLKEQNDKAKTHQR